MRYLIDTNVLVNLVEDGFISTDVSYILDDYANTIFISSVSMREFIVLVENNKVKPKKGMEKQLTVNFFDYIENELMLKVKYVNREHLKTFAKITPIEGHNDPADRLIIAQALTENITLISSDAKFPKYRKQGLELIQNR
jgi:PIN domain nuclease of toxin-antitoxin system